MQYLAKTKTQGPIQGPEARAGSRIAIRCQVHKTCSRQIQNGLLNFGLTGHTQWSFQMRFCLTWSGSLGNRTTATVMASAMNLFALLRASVLPAASSHAGLTDGSGLYWIPRCSHAESCSHRESEFEHPERILIIGLGFQNFLV